jgi:hypothetical protein
VLTLELKRAGESRKSAGLRPPGLLLKKDDGDRGRDGGVMALYLDAPPAASVDPPSMSVKLVLVLVLVLANANEPGLEFAGASMLPEDEVVIGERTESTPRCSAATRPVGGVGRRLLRRIRRVRLGWPARWRKTMRWERSERREPELLPLDGIALGYIGLEILTIDRSKLVEFDWRRSLASPASRRDDSWIPTASGGHRGCTVATWLRSREAGAQAGKVLGDMMDWWSRIVSLTCSNVQWDYRDQMDWFLLKHFALNFGIYNYLKLVWNLTKYMIY